jgi:hypothetical protein
MVAAIDAAIEVAARAAIEAAADEDFVLVNRSILSAIAAAMEAVLGTLFVVDAAINLVCISHHLSTIRCRSHSSFMSCERIWPMIKAGAISGHRCR